MTAKNDAVLVLTTTADDESARTLSRALVEERLAACVTRTSARSVYRWGDGAGKDPASMKVCEEDEVLLVIKTAASRVAELEARLLVLHPYDVPEVVRIAPDYIDEKYLEWLVAASAA